MVSCLACGSRRTAWWANAHDVEYKSVGDTFAYHRCADCASLSIDPVPDACLDRIYPPNYYSFAPPRTTVVDSVKHALDRRWLRGAFRRLEGDSLSVLDVGGGRGVLLDAAKEADARVQRTVVVDIDAGAADAARERGHVYWRSRIEDVQEHERFNAILLLNLIEHVRDPQAVLRKAASMLADGGIVLVKTPNYDALDARIFRHRDWGGYHCPRHWVLFTRDGIADAARRAGLRVVAERYTQGAPFWAASILALLDRFRLVRITRERPLWFHPAYAALAGCFAAVDFARGAFGARLSQMMLTLSVA